MKSRAAAVNGQKPSFTSTVASAAAVAEKRRLNFLHVDNQKLCMKLVDMYAVVNFACLLFYLLDARRSKWGGGERCVRMFVCVQAGADKCATPHKLLRGRGREWIIHPARGQAILGLREEPVPLDAWLFKIISFIYKKERKKKMELTTAGDSFSGELAWTNVALVGLKGGQRTECR